MFDTLSTRDKLALVFGLISFVIILYLGKVYTPKKSTFIVWSCFLESQLGKAATGALQKYSQNGFLQVPMSKKIQVTHDTIILRFDLPQPDITLGIDVGQHIEIL